MFRIDIKNILIVCVVFVLVACGSAKKVASNQENTQSEKKASSDLEIVVADEVDFDEGNNKVPKSKPNANINSLTQAYVETYAPLAMDEMKKYGIPASITLAQGILESGNGVSELALKSNNHFGIKCHKQWTGPRVYHDDDEKGECFRKYKHPATSYQDHSLFLTSRSRYASLFELRKNDYKRWAYGLKKAGYATDPRYPKKLIGYIETYDLDRYDDKVLNGENYKAFQPKKLPKYQPVIASGNTHTIQKGDTLYSLARKYGMTVEELKSLNGMNSNNLALGQVLKVKFTNRKVSPKIKSKSGYYTVKAKDTLYSLSRKFGLTVEAIKKINNLSSNALSIGQVLKIR